MRALTLASLVLLVAACSSETSEQGPTGTIPQQLEALEVAVNAASPEQIVVDGTLKISGQDRDFTVQVLAETGTSVADITVHSPTLADLAQLDGVVARATISQSGLHEERSILISDDTGPLYVADVGQGDVGIAAALGDDFATWGPTLGTDTDSEYDWEYTSARFKTDTGDVDVEPGHTATLTIDGASWRVGVIAAYKVEPREGAALPCGGISDLLSYEMLRVEAPAEPATLTRLANAKLAHLGCMSGD